MSDINFLLKRSNTADKRPTAANLDIGELALNYEGGDPGVYFEDDTGAIRKIGPVTVSATAPNSSAAGSTGNSVGEGWLDTSVTPNELKVWDGSAWQSTGGAGTPGGNTTEVQFNNAGAFDGNSNFTFNDADEILSVTEVSGRLDGAVIFIAESGEALTAGDVVYVSGVAGNFPVVSKAQANSALTMPAFGLVQDTVGASGTEVRVTTFGDFTNFDTSTPGWGLGDTLYVSDSTAGGLTTSAPTSQANLIQNIGKVGRVSASVGRIKVGGAGRSNATPNLNDGNIFIGNSSNQAATASFNSVLTSEAGIDGSATTATRFTLNDNNAVFDGTVVTGGAVLSNNGTIFFEEATANGSNYMAFQAPAALTTTSVFQLPDGDGTSGQVLSTNGSGVLSWTTSSATATVAERLESANGNQTITPNDVLNNWLFATNAAVRWELTSGGAWTPVTDSTYDIGLTTQRTANIYSDNVDSPLLSVSNQGEVRYYETTANGTNYLAFKAPASVTADTTFTLPDGDGTAGQRLATDGSGTLTWVSSGAGALTNGNILVGDAGGVAADVSMSGDITIDNTGATTIANDAVTTAKIIDDAVTGDKIANDVALAGDPTTTTQTSGDNSTKLATTAYVDTANAAARALPSTAIYVGDATNQATAAVVSGDATLSNTGVLTIANDAITTAKILDDAVTTGKIVNDAITGDKIVDGNVTGAKIEDNVALGGSPTTTSQPAGTNNTTIATTAYADNAAATAVPTLNDSKVFVGNASNVATGVDISGDATIDNTGALTIANDAITTAKIIDDAVTNAKIIDDAITTTKIQDDAVTNGKIVNDAITGDKIVDGNVTSAKIADDTIVNADINSAAAIDHSKLADITSGQVLVGNAANVPTSTAVSGDVTLSNTGVVDIIDDVNLGGNPTTTTQADTDNSTRVATTAFVHTRIDNAIEGLSTKQSVAAASTGDLTLSGTQTVDGIALAAGDRILVKDQTSAEENGIYTVAAGAWSRSDDASTWDELVGAFVFVTAGTANADSGYTTSIVAGGTLGTTAIPWTQFSSAGQVTAGAGLTKTGSTLDVVTADASRIVVNTNDIDLATTGVAAGTYTSVATDAYGRVTSGSTPTTFAGYSISDTSANLASAITDETGTGSLVFGTSPALSGTPTAPTASAGNNSTQLATTAYVDTAIGSGNITLNDTEILVGNGSNVATGVAMSGDATIGNTGAITIANDAVTTAKIIDDAVTGDKIADSVALAGTPTAATQTAGDNSTAIATTAYADAAAAAATPSLTDSEIFVGNGSNVATSVAMSGDATIDNTGAITIANDAVITAKILDANVTGSKIETSVALAGSPTTTTQTAADNSTKIATTAYADAAAAATQSLNDTNIFVGNGSNVATGVAMSGDATIDNAGALTIANDAVTTAKIIDDAVTGDKIADNVALAGSPTTTTQSASDNSTKIATTAYADAAAAAATPSLTDSEIFVGNGSNVATSVAMSGDAAIDNTGALTIANDAITTAKIIDDAVTGDKIADNVALAGSPTTTTQTQGDNSTKVSTTAYVDAAIAAVPGATQLSSGEIFLGNASNATAQVTMSGDVTIDNTGVSTIKNDVALAGSPTTTTQTANDNSTKIATTAYVDAAAGSGSITLNDTEILVGNGSNVATGVAMSGDAAIDNTGAITIANDAVTTVKILDANVTGAKIESGVALAGSPTTTTQTAADNSTKIATTAYADAAAAATQSLNDTNIFVGNGSNVATGVALSGDATIANTGAITIADDAVTGAKIADNVALAGSPTTTTQSALDNSTNIATTAYTDAAVTASNALTTANILVGNPSGVAADVAMSGDVTIVTSGATTIANDAITTAKIIDDAVTGDKIADNVALAGSPTTTTQSAGDNSTKVSTTAYVETAVSASNALTDSNIFVGNGSNVATGVAMSGDATIANTGAITIANDAVTSAKIVDDAVTSAKILDDTIVNADINSAAAIDYSKLAALTSASILVGNGSNVPTVTAISGDVTLSNTGAVDIIDDVNLGGNPTTTTQADTDNSTRVATTAFVHERVDIAIQGLSSKESVIAASTGNLTLSGTQTIDGQSLSAGDRVLVKDQATASENGIYDVAAGAWSRSSDANTWDELVGAFVFVEAGTANVSTGWTQTALAGGTLNTTAINWTQFSSAGQVSAGNGLTKTGSVLDVVTADSSRIVVNSDDIDLATTGVAAGTYTSVTIDTYGRATAGSTPTTFAGYSISDTSANLAAAITDETGSGSLVFATSPALAGSPTAPTQTAGTNDTTLATTQFVTSAAATVRALTNTNIFVGSAANIATGVAMSGDASIDNTGALTIAASVALSGSPTTTTQSAGTNDTTIATTAYTDSAVAAISGTYVGVAGDTMTGPLVLDDTSLQIQEAADTLTLTASALTADRAVNFQDAAGDIALVGAGSVDTRYVAVAGDTMTGVLNMTANILPTADSTYDLGSSTLRFANVYTGDLHLRNDRGDYTMIEEDDALTIRNNKTGKVYNIMMQERV